ncbi:auxin-induced protein 15A-like [Mangifera indica]|uniref:auxin-induced protein 15A-like n=1 Tax=Mangifera indica TaxID=29780 RepID=UPI001CFBD28E|nr:auxin-induced protein 15A-like [Mangifera indica]
MGFRLPRIAQAKRILRGSLFMANQDASMTVEVPKGHFAVYVGENQNKRFVIPISYLNNPSFQGLLSQAEEEFGFENPMGGLVIPCREDVFVDLISSLNRS